MSNVSVILCVPPLIKDNSYSIIDTVTEPMQCNLSTGSMVENTNKFGAYLRVEENDESHRLRVKMVENNIYNVEFVDRIQQNQMIGDTPYYCIPLSINAITVQGISYSDPYFTSFNLNYNKMALEAPEYMNKSDYAFKNSVVNVQDEPWKNETQLPNKYARDMISDTRMIVDDKMSGLIYHDNKSINDISEVANFSQKLCFANGDLTFDALLELVRKEDDTKKAMASTVGVDGFGAPRGLRLCGGGESSLNAASGWGSPPSNNNAGNWGGGGGNSGGQANNGANNTPQQWNNTAQRPPTSQADGLIGGGNGGISPNSIPSTNGPTAGNGNGNGTNTSSAKIEQLNSMREALYSQDGWGGQHVNQDTNWDVPGSPEPGANPKAEPTPGGGAGPPAWKPNINNGAFSGTDLWEANLRNGGQPPPQPASKTPWGHTPTTNIGGTWGEDDEPGDGNVWSGSGGAPPAQQWAGGAAPPPAAGQPWRQPKKDDWNAWGEPPRAPDHYERPPETRAMPPDPRHDLRGGISGRLNGDMWQHHHQPPAAPPPQPKMMPSAAINQWPSQGPKDTMKAGGWEEPSPPVTRRAAAFDDSGTNLWSGRGGGSGGVGGGPGAGMGGGGAGMARGGGQGPPAPHRAPPAPAKPDAVWGSHPPRNGSWDEPHPPSWERDAPAWDATPPGAWPNKPKTAGPAGWPEDIGEWGGPKGPSAGSLGKQIPKDVLYGSKQFRYLLEMGYKKEEAEAALRSRDMNAEEALELLASAGVARSGTDGWRRAPPPDDFAPPFPPPGGASHPPPPHASPAHAHKLLPQHHHQPPLNHHAGHHSYNPNSGSGNSGGGQPSTAQLRMLVQQIQMAVTAGYLNHQILNQPLAPQTLVLLNQLLQQIKVLQQLVQQHSLALSKANTTHALQYQLQINKAKQQITALQNQIATQQALYMKQHSGGNDLFKQSQDALAQLQNNFGELNIAKEPQSGYGGGGGNQQSRLNQWKLPALDKDGEGSEFSRAPGTAKSATSPQLNQLGLQPDSTWGVGREGGWGESGVGADVADGKDAWPSHPSHQPVYDLVPEFEPGKPWKGHQMKSVEDDPSMTPGSVVRSPLSLTSIKDTDMFAGKTSPPAGSERSLSSSTWSYAPPPATPGALKAPVDTWGGKGRTAPPGLNKAWPQHHNPQQRSVPSWQASTWLLLKNLTAQIDGSTLKTLCLQHGPLQNFHLYLNQGIALARYSSREEAAKAQMALNNCVLGNTTIFAESPAESDVQILLQHLSSGGAGGGGWRGAGGGGAPPTPKEPTWPPAAAFPPWPDSHDQRSTPSSLNSFLPQDLLGSETI